MIQFVRGKMSNSVIVKKIKNRSRIGSEWLELQHCFHPLNNTWEIQLVFYPNRAIFDDYKYDRFGLQEKIKNTMTFILSSKEDFERTLNLLKKLYLGDYDVKGS